MKKAQVTLFVLIGIVILIGVVVATTVIQTDAETRAEEVLQEEERQETSSEATAEIESVIRGCMRSLTREGLEEASRNGGVIFTEELDLRYDSHSAYENNALDFYGDQSSVLPYWLQSDDPPTCNNCEVALTPTPLGVTSVQVATYVELNLESCASFEQFSEFEVEPQTYPYVEVSFPDDRTDIELDWDLQLSSRDNTYSLDFFSTDVDIPYMDLYLSARTVYNAIVESQGVLDDLPSRYTQTVLSFLSFDESIPPLERRQDSGRTSNTWFVEDVKDEVNRALGQYTGFIDVFGLANPPELSENPSQSAFSRSLLRDSLNPILDDVEVTALYRPEWPLYLDINRGETLLRPDVASMGLLFIRLSRTNYDFIYDVSHPLVFSLDKEGIDFPFRFAVESNMRGSRPYTEPPRPSEAYVDDDTQITPPSGVRLDDTGGGRDITVRLSEETGSVESSGGLQFECLDQDVSLIDQTPEDPTTIETSVPACMPATIQYRGVEGFSSKHPITADEEYNLDIFEMEEISITPVKRMFTVPRGVLGNIDSINDLELENTVLQQGSREINENVIVSLRGINGTDFGTAAEIEGLGSGSIEIQPGTYEVTVVSTLKFSEEEPFETEDTEEGGVLGFGSETVEGITIDDSLPVGRVQYTVEFSPRELSEASSIDIPYLAIDHEQIKTTPDLQLIQVINNQTPFEDQLQINLN